jgi:hypothetical protein
MFFGTAKCLQHNNKDHGMETILAYPTFKSLLKIHTDAITYNLVHASHRTESQSLSIQGS